MKSNWDRVKEQVTATLKEKIGTACTAEFTQYGYDSPRAEPTFGVFNIIFPRQKYPKEFQVRVELELRELFADVTVGPTKVLLNRIIWR